MSNKLKQIAAILANDDVRDPRATMRAIADVLATKSPKGIRPVATITVFDNPQPKGPLGTTVAIEYSHSRLEPRHMQGAAAAIQEFINERAKEEEEACASCASECQPLSELFKKFEEAALAQTQIPKRRREDRV